MERGLCKRFADIRAELSLNKQDFANLLGIPSATVSDIELSKREPSKDVMLRLTAKCNVNLHWMLTGEGQVYVKKSLPKSGSGKLPVYLSSEIPEDSFVVPLLDQRLSAGNGAFMPDADAAKALIRVPRSLARFGDNIAALTVEGDSMYPTLSRGDVVVCDRCGWSGDGIYALRMDGDGYVKRLSKRPGKIVVISDNAKYPAHEEPAESECIEVIGRVHCAMKLID